MCVKIEFEGIPEIDVKTVSVIGSFNHYDETKGTLQKEEDSWITYVELSPGEHYYKFLINHEIRLNDPNANVYLPLLKDELWSVIVINEKGERLYSNEQYGLRIEEYAASGTVTTAPIGVNKKSYNMLMDKKIVVRFGFQQITGLHAVTAIWYNARGQVHEVTENMLYADEDPEKIVYLWYWMEIGEEGREYPEGLWTMKLFIDGNYILEDQFSLTRSFSYSKNTVLHSV